MGKKIRTTGFIMVLVGITMLASMALFVWFGYDFVLKKTIRFEEDQYRDQAAASAASITIPGFEKWNISAGETKVSSGFYNPEHNGCYFVLSVLLEDSEELIYESDYLKPGQHLYEVELIRPMEAGTYDAVLRYHTYSVTDFSPMNGASVPFSLVVK
ncbi:MAG: hypothetical protein ACI39W_06110 [Brotaphodocola sp.]